MKRILFSIPVIIILVIVFILHFSNYKNKNIDVSVIMQDSINYNISAKLDQTIDSFNLLKPAIEKTIDKIKYYEDLRNNYQAKIVSIGYKKNTDDSEINQLKEKLNQANNEIVRLKNELSFIKSKSSISPTKPIQTYIEPKLETPDENSLIIEINGKTKDGSILPTKGLNIYLIPYSKKAKKLMIYESSCDESIIGDIIAKYYNGLYFFNDVKAGKYLIKICTYYGDYRLVTKESGKYKVEMQVAPPLQ